MALKRRGSGKTMMSRTAILLVSHFFGTRAFGIFSAGILIAQGPVQ
jgi:hypothetical protein